MSGKVITILEAQVAEEQWDALRNAYRKITGEKEAIMPMRSFLAQSKKEPALWQILTEWQDMETLQKMRGSGEVPAGVRVFREAGAEPTLTIFEVKEELGGA